MALDHYELRGKPPAIQRTPVTGRVTKVDSQGVWVVPVDGDLRTPIGPCRGPSDIPLGTVVMVIYTQERPWVFGAELLTPMSAEARDLALVALLEATAQAWDEAVTLAAADALAAHSATTTDVHGIPDTAELETQTGALAKINAAIDALIDGAPGTLDTLAEIAAALAEDDDALAALTALISTKEPPAGAQSKADAAVADHEGALHGDTGRRLVVEAGDITELPDLEVVVRRVGFTVTMFCREAAAASYAGTLSLLTLPAGFRPDAPFESGLVVDQAGAAVSGSRLTVADTGVTDLSATLMARHYGALTFTTSDTWPAVLPGTEDT